MILPIAIAILLGSLSLLPCGRKHFISSKAFSDHVRGKPHKRRLRALETEPFTLEEAERAAGRGSYVEPKKRKMDTMMPEGMRANKEEEEDVQKKKAKKDGDAQMK